MTPPTSTTADPHGVGPDGDERRSPGRKTLVAASLVAVTGVAAALVGIVFPDLFAAAVATAVVVLIVALDRVLGPREQQLSPLGYWTL